MAFSNKCMFFDGYCIQLLSLLLIGLSIATALHIEAYNVDTFQEEYALPDLPFGDDALEPYIDAATVKVHHRGHHAAYTSKLNTALQAMQKEHPSLTKWILVKLLEQINNLPPKHMKAIKNNGGGYLNHALYWTVLAPNPNNEYRHPEGKIAEDIMNTFGNFSIFKNIFTDVSSSYFGSGYVWLCRDFNIGHGSHLMIATTANQDSPLSEGLHPILGIDLWEHAYYLKHQNARAAYIDDWWHVVSWDAMAQLDKWWSKRNMHDEL